MLRGAPLPVSALSTCLVCLWVNPALAIIPSENENITFHTFIMHSLNITRCIKHGVKHKVHQVQRKQIDSHKVVCLKCPPLARTQACKRVCH